jgi:hypothetical protein
VLSNGPRGLLDFASRHSLRLFMAALMFAAVFYCIYDLCFEPAYPIADWLINYSDGFVRRGLFGELILLAAHATHIPPPWLVVVLQLTIYSLFLLGVYRLAAPLRRDPLWYAMIFSPAALAFMILTAFNAVRKEMLAPAALTAVIFLMRRRPRAVTLSLIITVLFAVIVLSHEAPDFCLPYFFAVVALATRDLKYAAKVLVVPFVTAALLFELTRLHQGDRSAAIAICHSVGGRWLGDDDFRNLCSGAILRVGFNSSIVRHEVQQILHYWPLYTVLAVLSLAPYIAALIVLYKRDGLHFEVKVISSIAALCALASSVLFYFGMDWGRWIQMQILCLLLVILMAAQHAPSFLPDANVRPLGEGRPWRKPLLIAVFLYCTCWTLPGLGWQDLRFGYIPLPRFFVREFRTVYRMHGWQTIDRGW